MVVTKPAKDIIAGDRLLVDDGRPVTVTEVSRGMARNTRLVDFLQPDTGPRVEQTWSHAY